MTTEGLNGAGMKFESLRISGFFQITGCVSAQNNIGYTLRVI